MHFRVVAFGFSVSWYLLRQEESRTYGAFKIKLYEICIDRNIILDNYSIPVRNLCIHVHFPDLQRSAHTFSPATFLMSSLVGQSSNGYKKTSVIQPVFLISFNHHQLHTNQTKPTTQFHHNPQF